MSDFQYLGILIELACILYVLNDIRCIIKRDKSDKK